MLPDWFTNPDTVFKTVLWLLSPVYVWAAKKLGKRAVELNALASERAARIRLASLQRAIDNPPTLLGSIAYLVCFLPLPIVSVMAVGTLYFAPFRSAPVVWVDPQVVARVVNTVFYVICLINYVVFGVLTCYGIQVAYQLRHGEALYVANYKKSLQKQIDRLTSKFPGLAPNGEQ